MCSRGTVVIVSGVVRNTQDTGVLPTCHCRRDASWTANSIGTVVGRVSSSQSLTRRLGPGAWAAWRLRCCWPFHPAGPSFHENFQKMALSVAGDPSMDGSALLSGPPLPSAWQARGAPARAGRVGQGRGRVVAVFHHQNRIGSGLVPPGRARGSCRDRQHTHTASLPWHSRCSLEPRQ